MTHRVPVTYFLIGFCFILGLSLFLFKYLVAGFPLYPNEQVNSWHIESKITVTDSAENAQIGLDMPEKVPYFSQADEKFVSNEFGRYPSDDEKKMIWSKQKPDSQEVLYYHTVVYGVKPSHERVAEYRTALRERLAQYTVSSKFDTEDSRILIENIHKEISRKSSDSKSYVNRLFQVLKDSKNENIRLLSEKMAMIDDKTIIATEILRYADIPARRMTGILLSRAKQNTPLIHWVEVALPHEIIRFSPDRATIGMPSNVFPWYEGYRRIADVASGNAKVKMEFSVKHHLESALTESFWRGTHVKSYLYKISVYNMPVELQLVMSMLLLIPLGAVVCVFLKQVVGIVTYGTFMPVLIAISFRETGLLNGLMFFSSIVLIGLIFRSLFDNMRLLLVPRLAAILTIVVMIIFALSFLLNRFGFNAGGLSLFPLIILTMMIERMSVTWEEQGAKTSIRLAITSVIVATLCYLVIGNEFMEHLLMTFPELLLVNLAFALMLGRYTGFKLTEYYRFRVLQ